MASRRSAPGGTGAVGADGARQLVSVAQRASNAQSRNTNSHPLRLPFRSSYVFKAVLACLAPASACSISSPQYQFLDEHQECQLMNITSANSCSAARDPGPKGQGSVETALQWGSRARSSARQAKWQPWASAAIQPSRFQRASTRATVSTRAPMISPINSCGRKTGNRAWSP